MKIVFIQTGGTIDKDYPRGESNHGYAFSIIDPATKEILPQARAIFDYKLVSILRKDSLDITKEDRDKLAEAVETLSEGKIVITHGTDTILETAEVLSKISGKTIVLTGAMLPVKFVTSDASFNVGMATAAVQTLPAGVYIALYGHVVPWNEFEKIKKQYDSNIEDTTQVQGIDREEPLA